MSEVNLQHLAVRLARGEEAAFGELYDCCADRLYGYLLRRGGSPDAAADILQATFLRVVTSRRRFRRVANPVAYVFQIARHETARACKTRQRTAFAASEVSLNDIVDANDDDGSAADAEVAAAALARLNEVDRELVELKIYAGLTFREIAEATRRPPGTVATRYRRAMESLRGWLSKQYR